MTAYFRDFKDSYFTYFFGLLQIGILYTLIHIKADKNKKQSSWVSNLKMTHPNGKIREEPPWSPTNILSVMSFVGDESP